MSWWCYFFSSFSVFNFDDLNLSFDGCKYIAQTFPWYKFLNSSCQDKFFFSLWLWSFFLSFWIWLAKKHDDSIGGVINNYNHATLIQGREHCTTALHCSGRFEETWFWNLRELDYLDVTFIWSISFISNNIFLIFFQGHIVL